MTGSAEALSSHDKQPLDKQIGSLIEAQYLINYNVTSD